MPTLAMETQRQWSRRAIAQTTPILLALFSLVTLSANRLVIGQTMPVRSSVWYRKVQPTFSDALAVVRRQLWVGQIFPASRSDTDVEKIPAPLLERLTEALCYAA